MSNMVPEEELNCVKDSFVRFELMHETLSDSYDALVGDKRRLIAHIEQLNKEIAVHVMICAQQKTQIEKLSQEKNTFDAACTALKNELEATQAKLENPAKRIFGV